MTRARLDPKDLAQFSTDGAGWRADEQALEKTFAFGTYSDGVAFAVAVAMAAERRDHHPDLALGYRKVRVTWSTHDAGGTTIVDREMALETDAIASRHGGG